MLVLDFTTNSVELKRAEHRELNKILETEQLKDYFEVYDIEYIEESKQLVINSRDTLSLITTIDLTDKSNSLLLSHKSSSYENKFKIDFMVVYSDSKTYESVIGSLLYLEIQKNKATILSQDDQLYIFFTRLTQVEEETCVMFDEETLPLLPELEKFIREHVQFQAETSLRGVLK